MTFARAGRLAFMADRAELGNRRRRAFLLLGVGALAALGVEWLPRESEGRPPSPDAPLFWAADRDGERVVGLDADLFVARALALECPLDLVPEVDGSLWVLRADRADASAAPRLLRLSAGGEVGFDLPLPGARRLEAGGEAGGCLAFVEAGAGRALWHVRGDGGREILAETGPDAHFAAGGSGVLLTEGERLRRLGGEARSLEPGARVVALAGADEGWWLVEAREGTRSLRQIGPALEDRLVRSLAGLDDGADAPPCLAPLPSDGGVWLVDGDGAAWRFDGTGALLARGDTPPAGIEACLASADGGVLLATPGAIARLDARGRPLPGQGGFDFLVALARSPPEPR